MEKTNQKWQVKNLPDIDQRAIKKGKCPWCMERLISFEAPDRCPQCGDEFYGALTIED